MENKSSPSGIVNIQLIDTETGNVKEDFDVHNLITNSGIAFIAQSMIKTTTNTPAAMTHIGVGTGTTAAAATQTALVTEIGTRQAVTPTNITTTVTNDTIQYTATIPAGVATGTVTEAGIFNASTAGTMICRTVFSVTKAAADSLSFTWKHQIA